MKARLIEIIKVLKEVIKETNLNISDNTILEQSATYHRGELSQENKEKNMSNYQKPKIINHETIMKGINKSIKLASEKQVNTMNKFHIPFKENISSEEASKLIDTKFKSLGIKE